MINKFIQISLTIIISSALLYFLIVKSDQLYNIETKLLSLIFQSQKTTNIEFNIVNLSFEDMYYNKQAQHVKKTTVSLERFVELIDSNKIFPARNANFHNINECHNLKYLSRSGHDEYIVKVKKDENGNDIFIEMVYNPINKGTYNYFNQEGRWWQRSLHHIDVLFWLLYGTSYEDQSKVSDRLAFYFNRNNLCGG